MLRTSSWLRSPAALPLLLLLLGLAGFAGCDSDSDVPGDAAEELASDAIAVEPAESDAEPGVYPREPTAAELAAGLRSGPLAQARAKLDLAIPGTPPTAVTKAPLAQAYCSINVNGVSHDTETDYIPHVITCENGGANLEALKAQAIAARSVAYYAMAENGKICDGQGCQVYTCNAQPKDIHYQAAAETAGQYLSYDNPIKGRVLTYAFYVAGDNDQTAACHGVDGNAGTEPFVTYNEGKSYTEVEETTLGFQFKDPNAYGYGQNRGCMGQWSARCLENNKGYDHKKILQFFYGDDIDILTAEGACVGPKNSSPEGALEAADCESIRGWGFDADIGEPPVEVTLSFGGPVDDPNAVSAEFVAGTPRPDLCDALGSCDHGFEVSGPRSLRDGQLHPVHAYARGDADDDFVELEGSPTNYACAPPQLPQGVRRLVDDAALAAWGFDPFWQMATVPDAVLGDYPEWEPVASQPQLVRATGQDEVWLMDFGFRRHVPSPEVALAWGFDLGAVAEWPQAMLDAVPIGTPIRDQVFLLSGDAPTVYLIDDPQCPDGGIPGDPICPAAGGSGGDTESGSGGSDSNSGTGGTDGTSGTGGWTSGDSGVTGGTAGTEGDDTDSDGIPSLPPGYGEMRGEEEGCACASAPQRGAGGAGFALLGLLLAGLRRRR
ncbi:MAG: SpoIID/LytB domain-containing protein [Myxococcales bacterium]|nr:SpoIID/LytB domain-containing protein [Myxococcales bacterium]